MLAPTITVATASFENTQTGDASLESPAVEAVSWTHSSDLGMVPDNPSQSLAARQKVGKRNAELLRSFLNRQGTHLLLDTIYYITVDYRSITTGGTPFIVIDHPFHLKGGGLRIKYYGFQLKAGASFSAEGVRFESDGAFHFIYNGTANKNFGALDSSIDGVIGEIRFHRCHFGCKMLKINFKDALPNDRQSIIDYHVNTDSTHYYVDSLGIRQFVVDGCTCNARGGILNVTDGRIYEKFLITGNTVTEAMGDFLHYCKSRESGTAWVLESCPLYVENNYFRGSHYQSLHSTYHCPILASTNIVYFRRNVVENYITRSYRDEKDKLYGLCAYDSYLSSRQVYFEDNTISNVFAYFAGNTTKRSMAAPHCEWGKSKSVPRRNASKHSLRLFKGNKWKLDDAVVMSHLRGVAYGTDSTEAIIQLTDEEKKGLNAAAQRAALEKKRQQYIEANYKVDLIRNFSTIDEVIWRNNELDFGNGEIVGLRNVGGADVWTTPKYGNFVFEGNSIKARTMTGYLMGIGVPKDDKTLRCNVTIRNNKWQFKEETDFGLIFRRWSKPTENAWTVPMGDITVTGNRVVNGTFHINGGLCGHAIIKGNKTDKALSRDKTLKQLKPTSLTADF